MATEEENAQECRNDVAEASVMNTMRPPQPNRQLLTAFFLACTAAIAIHAQQPATGELPILLARVQANTDLYNRTVPSFGCDEHVTSQEFHDGKLKREITEDALFSVARSQNGLAESREVKAVDGKPSNGGKVKLPLTFNGGFSGALTKFLSREHRQCFDYTPDHTAVQAAGTIAFTFAAKPTALTEPACGSIQLGTTGKFVVDETSMQVIHIERTTPMAAGTDRFQTGTAAVDFAPVTLDGHPFWLPTTITAYTSGSSSISNVRFTAHYSNYHRFAAKSTILPVTNP